MSRAQKKLNVVVIGGSIVAIVCLAAGLVMPAKIASLAAGFGTLIYLSVAI